MIFNSKTFKDLNNNNNKNFVVQSSVNTFDGKVDHSALSIKLPVNGVENYSVNNKNYKLSPKNFLVVDQGEEVECNITSSEVVESICIYLDKTLYNSIKDNMVSDSHFLEDIAQENYYSFHSMPHHLQDDDLSLILKSLIRNDNFDSLNEEFFILFIESLISYQVAHKKALFSIKSLNFNTKVELFKRLQKAKAYIYDEYYQDLSLDLISVVCNLSKYHLLRSYKQVFGVTPHQDLLRKRIEKSRELLMQGISIEEVSFLCGFNNRRSFGRTFKQLTGFSPTAFVKSL